MDSLNQINTRINKLFKNPQINFFIIMFLVLLITCYTLLSDTLKSTVTLILSNPSVMVMCIGLILAIGYFDIGIASLMLILFFIVLFGSSNGTLISRINEGFKVSSDDDEQDQDDSNNYNDLNNDDDSSDVSNIDKHIKNISKNIGKTQSALKAKEEKDKKLDERVDNIKGVILGTINQIRNSNNDDYKRALLENKQAMLYEEHINNNSKASTKLNKNRNSRDDFSNTDSGNGSGNGSRNSSRSSRNGKNNSGRKRENFQTIDIRALDPSNEDDTNLLITKEILQDMLNRIEYNYESNKYLRKYIKHRVEEIIEINKLTEDD
jgi:hypothetical protein